MAKNIWEEFDSALDVKGMQKEINDAKENQGNFKEVPHGTYEVSIDKLELKKSKNGDPMVSCWFKVLTGEFKNSIIFMNQVITQGFQVHIVNEFLRSLDTGLEIEFVNYSGYAKLLNDVKESIDKQKLEYGIEYGEKKGFNTFKITDVFETQK